MQYTERPLEESFINSLVLVNRLLNVDGIDIMILLG